MANAQSKALPKRSPELPHVGMSDGQLLARFSAGRDEASERSFSVLVHRHGPMVLRVCLQILGDRHRAEDAFQATFLVLARKAGSIRQPELLGNWLYGVALRTAWEARMRDGRRQQHEASASELLDGEPVGNSPAPEALVMRGEEFEVLHEEVSQLPDRYRVPVVLCEMEGLTYQEAAQRMRCPVNTIGVRLKRARERLRVRLIRRGILPAAGLTSAFFAVEGATAWLPAPLVDSTARAASEFAASDVAAAEVVSASVVAIAEAVLKTMALARIKLATSSVLIVGLTAAVGTWCAFHHPRTTPQEEQRAVSSVAAASAVQPPEITVPAPRSAPVPPQPAAGSPTLEKPEVAKVEDRPESKAKPDGRVIRVDERRPVRDEVARGELLFMKEWVPGDPMSPDGDGLGPLFNETSCVGCHGLGAPGGAGPDGKNVVMITALSADGRAVSRDLSRIHPGLRKARSTVLHRYGTDPAYALWRQRLYENQNNEQNDPDQNGKVDPVTTRIRKAAARTVLHSRMNDRTQALRPEPNVSLRLSERNTPALFGAGLIDAIPSEVLIYEAENQPEGVRGRVSHDALGRVGRFGWKAQITNLHEFVRGACAGELGLEVPGHSQPASPVAPNAKPKGLDMTDPECDALVAYVRALPAPVVVDPSGPQGTRDMVDGRRLFAEAGCATCHAPSLGDVRGIYSDLLLHDLGPSLNDAGIYYESPGFVSGGGPRPGEWRTPPLWGFRDSGPYLHDGRAQTLEEAVALHGGQGAKSARAFFELTEKERFQIETFLKSLVAPSSRATRGVMLAAELEARILPDDIRAAELHVRKQRESVAAREEQKHREELERQRVEEARRRAQAQYPIAINLDKMGKTEGALEFYRSIARDAPDTEEGRLAGARIAEMKKLAEAR